MSLVPASFHFGEQNTPGRFCSFSARMNCTQGRWGRGAGVGTWEEPESPWGEIGEWGLPIPSLICLLAGPRAVPQRPLASPPRGSPSKWPLCLSPWSPARRRLRRHITVFPLKRCKRSHVWGAVAGCWQLPLTPAPPHSLRGAGLSRGGELVPGATQRAPGWGRSYAWELRPPGERVQAPGGGCSAELLGLGFPHP